ncbi:hypothetical protein D3C80_915110 [compost metagenome]
MASTTNTIVRTMYGMIRRDASSCNMVFFNTASVVTFNCSSIFVAFLRITAPRKIVKIPANLLQIPIMLMRLAALSMGPKILTYGLQAVCNNAIPEA